LGNTEGEEKKKAEEGASAHRAELVEGWDSDKGKKFGVGKNPFNGSKKSS